MLGLYWDNGKENGNYYSILGFLQRPINRMVSTLVSVPSFPYPKP